MASDRTPLLSQKANASGFSNYNAAHSNSEIRLAPVSASASPLPTPQSIKTVTLLPPAEHADQDAYTNEFPWGMIGSSQANRGRTGTLESQNADSGIDPDLDVMRPRTPLIRPLRSSSYMRSPSYRRSTSRASRPTLYSGRSHSRGSVLSRGSTVNSEGGDHRVRSVELFIAYLAFSILGACVLLAWNCIIVAGRYFKARLEGSPYEASFAAFVACTFTVGNLVFLWRANATQVGADLSLRIQSSIIVLVAVVGVFILSTQIEQIEPSLFFGLLITMTLVLAASASYVQNAVVALCSHFGPFYLSAVLSGQGLVGVAVALMQLIAAYTAAKTLPHDDPTFSPPTLPRQTLLNRGNLESPVLDPVVLQSAFTFFLSIAVVSGVCLCSHAILVHLPLYHRVVHTPTLSELDELKDLAPNLRTIEKKVRKLGLSMFWVFAVSLAVFPAITSSILSISGSLGPVFSQPHLFVPIVFFIYAVGDWLGRVVTQIKSLTFTDWRLLMIASGVRTVFIPLLLLCNVQVGFASGRPYINSDCVFLFIMFAFAFSNGYVSSLVFLAAVVEPSLDEEEIEVAATCLAFYLTAGLAAGSFVSFPVRAVICGCNPFL